MAEAGPELLGVHDAQGSAPYRPRAVDDALEDALGADRPLVAVTGDRLAGSSRALHRALRRMQGDRLLLPVADPHAVDLPAAIRAARTIAARSGPVVIAADDAPPAFLDQVDDAVLGMLGGDVRLVLTTRRTFLGAYLAPATRARLEGALIEIPAGLDARPVARARAVLDPVGWSSRVPLALLRTAVDWERLGVPLPLTPALLAEVAPLSLTALGAPPADRGELRRAVRDLLRADHGGLRVLHALPTAKGRTRLAADRVFSSLADGEAGWAVPEDLARDLWHRLAPEERARVARVALARGEGQVALWLATQVPPDDFEPEVLYRLGVVLAERSAAHTPEPGRWDGGALRWLTAALDRADADLVPRAHRAILAVESRREQRASLPTVRLPADDALEVARA
ncbi:hypothetical protein EV188_10422 [Actinomycetospora succinea]|uniref:Uncharacterized protein n=1 Tax=Actinomycetospora succinea TaxID=663603 RepID=A0A4R6V9B4_9PSEU|nr:hypothetical protein [Actinomycetospora succinea]TDQ58283.1 hypothetical protein EV188_10422 [Actinomycetospora succinea]